MLELLNDIIELMVGGITGVASGIGSGLSELAQGIFVTPVLDTGGEITGYELTTFGGLIILFAGIGLAIGLCRWVLSFITSLGAFN